MSLSLSTLRDALESLFTHPPLGHPACAQAWSDALKDYASGVIPHSASVTSAATTLKAALATAFATPAAAPGMETAFTAFGAAIGAGMAGFAPVPPPAPVGFATQFAGPKPTTHAQAAAAIAGLIDAWMKTGSATLIAPPNTPVVWT